MPLNTPGEIKTRVNNRIWNYIGYFYPGFSAETDEISYIEPVLETHYIFFGLLWKNHQPMMGLVRPYIIKIYCIALIIIISTTTGKQHGSKTQVEVLWNTGIDPYQ